MKKTNKNDDEMDYNVGEKEDYEENIRNLQTKYNFKNDVVSESDGNSHLHFYKS